MLMEVDSSRRFASILVETIFETPELSRVPNWGPVPSTLGKGVQGGEAPLWYIMSVQISSFRFAIMERSRPVECIMNSTEKSMQVEKVEKWYTLTTNKPKACQHYLQRPRGTSRVFIDFHWFSLIFIVFHWFSLIFIVCHWFYRFSLKFSCFYRL